MRGGTGEAEELVGAWLGTRWLMKTGHYREEARRHEALAVRHDEVAQNWEASGDPRRATLERRSAKLERMAAQLARDRAALSEDALAIPEAVRPAEVQRANDQEARILRAVEILRGTKYDFRVEATIDVAKFFGTEVLVEALARLDGEIKVAAS